MTLTRNACACIAIAVVASPVLPIPANAQDEPRGGLFASVHFERIGILDANASPLRYGGGELGGAFGYRSVGSRLHFTMEASVSAPQLRSRASDEDRHTESAHAFGLRLALQRAVVGGRNDNVRVYAGAQILAVVLARKHEYDLGATENFADIFAPLQATAGWEYRIRDNILSGTVAIPVVALVSRTPYHGLKEVPALAFASGLDARAFHHALRLENPMSQSWSARFELITLYISHDDPRKLRLEDHRAAVSLEYRRRRSVR